MHGALSRSRRLAAGWLLGAVLGILALAHVPAAASWAGPTVDTVSGSKIVAMPAVKRLHATPAELGQAAGAVLPSPMVLTLAAGLVVAALLGPAPRARSRPRPSPARGPPDPLR